MSSDGFDKELNYNMILMSHINRLSMVTTGNGIDNVSSYQANNFAIQTTNGEKNLEWGVHFLYCLVPEDLLDEKFNNERKEYLDIKEKSKGEKVIANFLKFRALINLLNRKGLLMDKPDTIKLVSKKFSKDNKPEEVWEA